MRHDSHANAAPRQPGRRPPRPDLGRPSLFADFDQDSVEDVDPQRVRLLSTLESQRGVRGRPRARRLPTGRPHPWLTRALMALMALGMLVMLLSFIQLLRRPPPALPTAQTALASVTPAEAGRTSTTAPGSATLHPTQGEAAEIIDLSPPGAGSPTAPLVTSTSPVPAANALPASASIASIASTGREGDQAANRARTASPPVVEAERTARTAKPSPPRTSAKREAGASQDDVALVEAMLAHAGPRKAPPAPTAQLQQCGSGSSPETAVCRAKVCVQHPSLPACHTP